MMVVRVESPTTGRESFNRGADADVASTDMFASDGEAGTKEKRRPLRLQRTAEGVGIFYCPELS